MLAKLRLVWPDAWKPGCHCARPAVNGAGEAFQGHSDSLRPRASMPWCAGLPPQWWLVALLQPWQKQSRCVGWTTIFWWLIFFCAIWVDMDFVHGQRIAGCYNCHLCVAFIASLFSFFWQSMQYVFILINNSINIWRHGNHSTLDLVADSEVTQIVGQEAYAYKWI